MMLKRDRIPAGLGACLLVLAAFVATGAIAQTTSGAGSTPHSMPDMRLWSFGECDNRFPYTNSEEHKECVRVVGSEDAKDARALRVCETSNPRDPEEVARCKSTYAANKHAAAQSGYVPNAVAQPLAPPTAEEVKRVKAIAAAAVERDKAAAAVGKVAVSEPDEPVVVSNNDDGSSYSMSLILALAFGAGLLGTAAVMSRRKQAALLSGR
ncbi:MAG: hypothetical protein ABI724_03865 [Betaproteobacteria bacterium]